ncbi:MAG: DUF2269 family protein [Solirubrobacteraceae bacterium]
MTLTPAASLYDYILAVHIMAVVIAFGFVFALPVVYMVAVKHDPRSLPVLHRIEYMVERLIINPALLVLLLAGIYLASKGHYWSEFFVQWGLAAAVVIGAVVGAVMIPTAKRAEQAAKLAVGTGGESAFEPSAEYQALARRLNIVGSGLGVLVALTILFMAVKP